jgi:endonuclease YncB( thermonuclease family)
MLGDAVKKLVRVLSSSSTPNWDDVSYESCEAYTPVREGERAKVVKVTDGDTVCLAFNRDGGFVRMQCRLQRIDTPEIHSSDAHEKQLADEARTALQEIALDKVVVVSSIGHDKYGRVLGELTPVGKESTLSDAMLAHPSFCHAYDGGKKRSWS